jgi:hypothetical protein
LSKNEERIAGIIAARLADSCLLGLCNLLNASLGNWEKRKLLFCAFAEVVFFISMLDNGREIKEHLSSIVDSEARMSFRTGGVIV